MTPETKPSTGSETEIRELIDTLLRAASAKDVESSLAPYAANVVAFDLVDPLQYKGVDTIRTRLNEWFSSFEGPIELTFDELEITAGDDVGFCHGLHHLNGTKTDGTKLEMSWRTTICLRKVAGTWTITHSHDSVPFNPQTGQASLDLKP